MYDIYASTVRFRQPAVNINKLLLSKKNKKEKKPFRFQIKLYTNARIILYSFEFNLF